MQNDPVLVQCPVCGYQWLTVTPAMKCPNCNRPVNAES